MNSPLGVLNQLFSSQANVGNFRSGGKAVPIAQPKQGQEDDQFGAFLKGILGSKAPVGAASAAMPASAGPGMGGAGALDLAMMGAVV